MQSWERATGTPPHDVNPVAAPPSVAGLKDVKV